MRIVASCLLFCCTILAQQAPVPELPVTGLAGVGLLTSDLEKARGFYTGTLGYEEAFGLKNQRGQLVSAFFKVNDNQYIQVSSGLQAGYDVRMTHVAVQTPDVQGLRKLLLKRGVIPGAAVNSPDGNLACSLRDPDGTRLEFVEYGPVSLQTKAKGKFLSERRISQRLWHAGVVVAQLDRAMAFYGGKLGFREFWRGGPKDGDLRWINLRMPGVRGEYVEFMLYTDAPNRDQLGVMQHICLEVPDINAAFAELQVRGVTGVEPRLGRNGHWQINLLDPDGTRVELMETRVAKK